MIPRGLLTKIANSEPLSEYEKVYVIASLLVVTKDRPHHMLTASGLVKSYQELKRNDEKKKK